MCGGGVNDDGEEDGFFEKAFEDYVSLSTKVYTLDLADYDKDGFKAGGTSKKAVEGYKELSGVKAAEESNKLARDQFEQEKATALQDRKNAQAQNAADALSASRSAGAVRSSRSSGGNTATTSRFSDLGGDERDFLGL